MVAHKGYKSQGKIMNCKIRLKGHFDRQFIDWFEGMTIDLEENGDTVLTCMIIDQAALNGLLKKIRDSGMSLISLNPIEK